MNGTLSDVFAEYMAAALQLGACIGGHSWEGARYLTESTSIDPVHPLDVGTWVFTQRRRCLACGARVDHVAAFVALTLLTDEGATLPRTPPRIRGGRRRLAPPHRDLEPRRPSPTRPTRSLAG